MNAGGSMTGGSATKNAGILSRSNELKALAEKIDLETVIERLNQLQHCRERMLRVMNRRVEFEMTLIKMCSDINKRKLYSRLNLIN